ncbi:MAG: NAD(P)-binding domain-containing protein [Prolixibacteraceae bacterium]|jgi:2-hydroxy-3-oxopropionate reductase|nr:NAD(P)-binding domain-containing protein [Prolixibacteraceae bacterium]
MEIIGFIGLGTMGKPMALNLIKAGYKLIVNDIDRGALELLVSHGAQVEKSYNVIAEKCSIVITMLPEAHHVEEVVLGTGGLIDGAHEGFLLIDMSSIIPETSKKIQKTFSLKGADSLDAPVSGGPTGAENGTLSIMVGGTGEAFQKGLLVMKALGQKILHMGEPGSGQLTKLCNQILIGVHIQAVAEAYALAAKSGLDIQKVREALMGGVANSRVLELQGQKIIDRTFDQPAFKLKLHRKDLNAALMAAKEAGVPLYATAFVVQQMEAAMAQGYAELDHTTLMLIEEQLANIKTS